ncbi:MAG: HPP family protein, partial [Halodesulfurarchaeum sp.]
MPDGRVGLGGRVARAVRQLLQLRVRQFRRWLESTSHIEHLSVLVFAPLLIALVTVLSNSIAQLSFLLFPPLASGTYTLFADPEGKYSDPVKFVGGMTLGAFIGWLSLEVSAVFLYDVPPGAFRVHAGGAALGIFVTGLVTWLLDLEEPTAFSTALLVLITGTSQIAYIIGVAVSSAFVAAAFHVWREMFYEERA